MAKAIGTTRVQFLRLACGSLLVAVIAMMKSTPAGAADEQATLREAAKGAFLIGAAVRPDLLDRGPTADLIAAQFDALTPENVAKPMELQPRPGEFHFDRADVIADFAASHGQQFIGHTLCWHQQAPAWLFQSADGKPLPREEGLANLRTHITEVMSHFRGRVRGWDVVNEAIDDTDAKYLRDTPALRSIGEDYIIQAFKFAQSADPDAELYYNDYNNELGPKLQKTVRLLNELKAAGVRIDGVGMQGHWQIGWPSTGEIETGITTLAATGMKVHITELDVDVLPRKGTSANITDVQRAAATTQENPYITELPAELQQKLAERYQQIFKVLLKHKDVIDRVTFWGVNDGMSWLNDFPVRGRTNYPLLFDRGYQPKPAFFSVIRTLQDRAS
ncbi:MAG: 1,4-beta-xylanase [Phycisphaerales bacterium]|nr:1,4-beta-xylanase [Phycisphaerales bacterium]